MAAAIYWRLSALLIGVLLDAALGDPDTAWHPICLIGRLIAAGEKLFRRLFPEGRRGELAGGLLLAACVLLVSVSAAALLLKTACRIHRIAGFAASCAVCWFMLSARCLAQESGRVQAALDRGDLPGAREAVARIVGRDTKNLDSAGVIRAAVETVAENTSDGVIAPLFWMFLFGPAGGVFYKSVNTMDSMVGYRNERYLYFGRAAARLDDLMNLIPSRLSALCMVAAAWLLPGYDGASAWKIWRRDRRCHRSPNSAQTESACAGALGLKLGGDAFYFGVLYHKPAIGDQVREPEAADIGRANRLMVLTSALFLAAGCLCALLSSALCGWK